ncbi:MAG: hydantoinase/oxoprolinase family protein [Pseudoclavibacter sp.]
MVSDDHNARTDPNLGFTIEIDTGGTFTDGYVSSGDDDVVTAKTDTTPYDLTAGVLACIDEAADRLERSRADLLRATRSIRLSTTVGTNTLINRNGPEIGLLLGDGSRDVVDELSASLPLNRALVAVVPEGDLSLSNVQVAVRDLLERGARVLVIALSEGPDLEVREAEVRNLVGVSYPRHYLGAVPVLPSHQVTSVGDARVRVQTAVLSAYLHPVMSAFLYRVEDALRTDGYTRPLLIANADGGTSRVAKTTALRTWGSGPAGGVAATATMATELDLPFVVGYDVGGTSTDVCIVRDQAWESDVQPRIEDIEVSLPSLSLVSAPIGGGSIAHTEDRELRVGPRSAGAQPGPACFGLGGVDATVTDAACHLGFVDPSTFLGGRKRLDVSAATQAIERLGGELGLDPDATARAVIDSASRTIAASIANRTSSSSSADLALFATGGAGSMLAGFVHTVVGAPSSYAFPTSPVFSAFGLTRLDVRHSYEIMTASATFDDDLESARTRAVADMLTEGYAESGLRFEAHTEVVGDDGAVGVVDGVIRDRHAAGFPRLTRLVVSSPTARGRLPSAGDGTSHPIGEREIRWADVPAATPLYDWLGLPRGTRISGPAVLETPETTLVVPPGLDVEIGQLGEARMTHS